MIVVVVVGLGVVRFDSTSQLVLVTSNKNALVVSYS